MVAEASEEDAAAVAAEEGLIAPEVDAAAAQVDLDLVPEADKGIGDALMTNATTTISLGEHTATDASRRSPTTEAMVVAPTTRAVADSVVAAAWIVMVAASVAVEAAVASEAETVVASAVADSAAATVVVAEGEAVVASMALPVDEAAVVVVALAAARCAAAEIVAPAPTKHPLVSVTSRDNFSFFSTKS